MPDMAALTSPRPPGVVSLPRENRFPAVSHSDPPDGVSVGTEALMVHAVSLANPSCTAVVGGL